MKVFLFLFEGVKRGLHFVQQQRQYHIFFQIKLCRVQLLLQFLEIEMRERGKESSSYLELCCLRFIHPSGQHGQAKLWWFSWIIGKNDHTCVEYR